MKAKLAAIFYWLADKIRYFADWLSGNKAITFTPKGTVFAIAGSRIAPPEGGTVHIEGGKHSGEWVCRGIEQSPGGTFVLTRYTMPEDK